MAQQASRTIVQADYDKLRRAAGQMKADEVPGFQQKATAGDLESRLLLGMIYELGCGIVPRDPSQSLAWYKKASEQTSVIAETLIGNYYDTGAGHDPAEAFKWYAKAADQDDAVAQYNVGTMYEQGTGVQQSFTQAAMWYRKALGSGSDDALKRLIELYDSGKAASGKGLQENQAEGLNLLRSVVDGGNAQAQLMLAAAYKHGALGLHSDQQQAMTWLSKAAEKNAEAQAAVGWAYFKGQGMPRNETEAVNWFKKAADGGSARGQTNLAFMYEEGKGVGKNLAEALKWYQASAELGDATARYALARIYEDGRGVPRDRITAIMWFLLAEEAGGPNFMSELHPNLTHGYFAFTRHPYKSEYEEAEKRARAWKEQHSCR